MKTLALAFAATIAFAGLASAQSIGVGVSGGVGGSAAGATQDGGTLTGGTLASLGFAATNTTSLSGAQNVTQANNLGGTSTSLVENTGNSQSTHGQLGLGVSGAGSNFAGGGLAGGAFAFRSLNIAVNPNP